MAARIKRPSIWRLLLAQLAVMGLTMGVATWSDGGTGAFSAVTGGAVAFLPNAFFAWRAFRYQGLGTPRISLMASIERKPESSV